MEGVITLHLRGVFFLGGKHCNWHSMEFNNYISEFPLFSLPLRRFCFRRSLILLHGTALETGTGTERDLLGCIVVMAYAVRSFGPRETWAGMVESPVEDEALYIYGPPSWWEIGWEWMPAMESVDTLVENEWSVF